MISLPIDSFLPEIISNWKEKQNLIINASAGSGKTTRLPWAFSKHSEKKIIVLEPRKLAAKMAALRISQENNLTLGNEIGYAYRDDVNFTKNTKVIFFTEGTFLHFIEDDEFFKGIDTIIFDEFHERHLETDLAIALIRKKVLTFPEIKIVLMSATIETVIANSLNANIIEINARLFEVKVHYLPNVSSVLDEDLTKKVYKTIQKLPPVGDILVFLPGMREILKTKEMLNPDTDDLYILHSEIEKNEQEKIMEISPKRKIILATNIAESSLTIPGIQYVIDSGIARVSEFNPWTGFRTLVDRPITQSSAIQRMYRAGRTQNGECFRLYSEFDFNQREQFTKPAILTSELFDTYLLSAHYQHDLNWITPPPTDKWKQAQTLNILLGTINEQDEVTKSGKFALDFNLSIRLATILYQARTYPAHAKRELIDYIATFITKEDPKYLLRRLNRVIYSDNVQTTYHDFAQAILAGMIDQVAKYRSSHHDFIHYSGKTLRPHSKLNQLQDGFYILTSINHRGQVEQVLEINEEWLIDLTPYPLTESLEYLWEESIVQKIRTTIGSIVLEESMQIKFWHELNSKEKEFFLQRNKHRIEKIIHDFSNSSLFKRAQFYCKKKKLPLSFNPDLKALLENSAAQIQLMEFELSQLLQEQLMINLEQLVPESIVINKKTYQINYDDEASIAGHIQEFFGITTTPVILGDSALTLILLGPHKRPIQYTKDLAGFWQRTYPQFLKEWRREYPRHHWPDNPWQAPAVLLKRQLPPD